MDKKQLTIILYHVVEDKDDPEQPNAFFIPKSQQSVKPIDIQNYFPLKGEYILRYKYEFEKKKFVWMDLSMDASQVPVYNGNIVVKATRVSWNNEHKQNGQQIQQQEIQKQSPMQKPQVQQQNNQQNTQRPQSEKQSPANQNSLDIQNKTSAQRKNFDLFSFEETHSKQQNNSSSSKDVTASEDLIDL